MNRTLSAFQPPSRPKQQLPTWKDYQGAQEKWLDDYQKYVFEYINQLVSVLNTGAQGFALTDVPVAGTVYITAYTTIMAGTGTISTINTSPGFSGQIHLIAEDGFSTDTAGNISAAIDVIAGQAALFDYNPVTQRWYPVEGAMPPPIPSSIITVSAVSSDTTLSAPVTAFVVISVDTTSGNITITLPATSLAPATIYDVKNASGANNVILTAFAGETIDGSASVTIAPTSSYEVAPVSGGGSWVII